MKFNRLYFQPLVFIITILLWNATLVVGQVYIPGNSILDSTGYIEYLPGNLPIVISVPHGGYEDPPTIPDRNCDLYTCVRDSYTQELGRSISDAFYDQTGCYPHMIINLLNRRKFDANRDLMEAADGNMIVEDAWHNYHEFINSSKLKINEDYNYGLFLDLHGHGHELQRLELGYRITKSELQQTNEILDGDIYVEKSSIRNLVKENLLGYSHSALLRGNNSFGTMLNNVDVPAIPSVNDPYPEEGESYFSGGYNTERHGSSNDGKIDAIQLECHQSIRFDSNKREKFAVDLTTTINDFINTHYDASYGNNYCQINTSIATTDSEDFLAELFPNPASDILFIRTVSSIKEIAIFTSFGELVINDASDSSPINITTLSNGYYILRVVDQHGIIATRNFIKF